MKQYKNAIALFFLLIAYNVWASTDQYIRLGFGGGGTGTSIGDIITGGTSGSVLFIDSATKLAQDNAKLFWDDTNFRLGIGTASPAVALNVVGASNLASIVATSTTNNTSDQLGIMAKGPSANDSAIGLYNTAGGGTHWTFRSNTNGNFEFIDSTAGQLDMAIHQTSGIVSIGVGYTGTGAQLDVAGGVRLNTASAKPTCASGTRGTIWVQQVGAGTTDTMFVCLKAAADTYSWVSIVTGG